MTFTKPQNSRQLGSNPGGEVFDEDGERFYLKTPHNPEQAHVEVATSKLYNHVGVKTLSPFIHKDDNGTHVISKWQDSRPFGTPTQIHNHIGDDANKHVELAKIHHMAVITKNHDVVGLDYDNLLKSPNGIVSADQGGAMMFRAMGEHKDFGHDVDEIESFQKPTRNSGKVFGKVHPLAYTVAAHDIKKNLTDEVIDSVTKEHGLSHVAETLKKRRDLLVNHYSA